MKRKLRENLKLTLKSTLKKKFKLLKSKKRILKILKRILYQKQDLKEKLVKKIEMTKRNQPNKK